MADPLTAPLNALAARARSALAMPTSYWLGQGDWQGERAPDRPGTAFDPVATLAALAMPGRPADDVARLQRYRAGLAQAGLRAEDLPRQAADCSGFVHWALRQPRVGWNTTRIHHDALSAAPQRFVRADRPQPGAIVVYPDGHGEAFGHIGILVEGPEGRLEVIHCDAGNYLLPPPTGAARNAIAQTGLEKFQARPDQTFVVWQAFMR